MREPNEFRGATASRPRRAEARHVLVIVNPQSRGGLDALAPTLAVLRDTGLEPEVAETTAPRHAATITVAHVRIETDPPRPKQADDELLGLTSVEIRVEPSAVRVLVPNAALRRWRIPRLAATCGHTEQLKSCTP